MTDIYVLIYVLSISFQVAGALLLMIDCISTKRERILRRFAGNGIISRDNNTNVILYNEDGLKTVYKEVYLTKCAFLFIATGYFLGVFGDAGDISRVVLSVGIIFFTITFMVLSRTIVGIIIKYNKEVNQIITNDEVETYKINVDIENISNDAIDEMIDKMFG